MQLKGMKRIKKHPDLKYTHQITGMSYRLNGEVFEYIDSWIDKTTWVKSGMKTGFNLKGDEYECTEFI